MFQAKLQMRLTNAEPKCANCKHWFPLIREAAEQAIGKCGRMGHDAVMTTDLAVCSKWEMRADPEPEETP